jgi:hypothetical protein
LRDRVGSTDPKAKLNGDAMAIDASSRTAARFAIAAVAAVLAFPRLVHAAEPEPDRVSLREETVNWSTAKYETTAENGLVDGSLDRGIILDRTFRAYLLENRYLKVTLVPEFGGRILSIIYKPTGHEQLYRTEVGVPTASRAARSITTG